MRIALIFLTLLLLFVQHSFAKTTTLQTVLAKYAKAKALQAEISKTDEKIVLGTKSESKGLLLLEKNKIFISQEGEKKAEFYYADNVLTLVEYPDQDFDKGGPRKVSTFKKSVPPFVKSLLNLFSSPKNFNKDFKAKSETKSGNEVLVELQPVTKNIKNNLKLKIDSKNNEITEIVFVDDVDTRTTIKFSKIQLNPKLSKTAFQFAKLKTDEVISE